MEIEFNLNPQKIILVASLIFFSALYIYYGSFTNSFGFGDEPHYYLAAKSINEGHFGYIDKLYAVGKLENKGLYLEHPYLSYWIPALFYFIGNGNLHIFKLYTPLFGVGCLFLTYIIGKKIKNEVAGIISMFLLGVTPLFLHFSIISYNDVVITFFILLFFYSFLTLLKNKNKKNIILCGIALGIAMLTKENALVIPFSLAIYLLTKIKNRKKLIEYSKIFFVICAIGGLMYSPWLAQNFIRCKNPLHPFLLNTFGVTCWDEKGYEFWLSKIPETGISDFINFVTLSSYMHFTFYLSFFGLIYILLFKEKYSKLLLIFAIVLTLPFMLVERKDIRYLMPSLPFLSVIISLFFNNLLERKEKTYKILVAILIIIITITNINLAISEAKRIDKNVRKGQYGIEYAYEWLKENTPTDAVVFDLLTPNCVMNADRICTFIGPYVGADQWEFWNKNEQEGLELLKKQNISYVVVETHYFQSPEVLKRMAWIAIPKEMVNRVEYWDSFNLMYFENYVLIYKVNYDGYKELDALDKSLVFYRNTV